MSKLTLGRSEPSHERRHVSADLLEPLALLCLILLLLALSMITAHSVDVTVDGMVDTVRTHRRSIDKLLLDMALRSESANATVLADTDATGNGLAVYVERARQVHLAADGRYRQFAGKGETPAELLAEAGVTFDPADRVLVQGEFIDWHALLPTETFVTQNLRYGRAYPWDGLNQEPLQVRLYRSTPILVEDGGLVFDLRTTAQTVGEALREAKLTLYLGDRVQPSLGSPIGPSMRVSIQRSIPVSVEADGEYIKTRSRVESVADLLADMKIGLSGADQVSLPLETPLYDNIAVEITRVSEEVEVNEEIAPFETVFEPDPNLPIDAQRVLRPGAEGVTRTRQRIRYEDGEEVQRAFEDTWVAQEPAQRVIAYGTRIESKTATTEDGQPITYWRKIRMRASSYSAGTAGLAPDHPWYGRTYSGEPMRGGIVAVDPSIVPLRSQVYIPDYGYGDALDTGSAIRARRIDLGYDDEDLVLWNSWVDVYLLWPPPPEYQITWVLPNWPRLPG